MKGLIILNGNYSATSIHKDLQGVVADGELMKEMLLKYEEVIM